MLIRVLIAYLFVGLVYACLYCFIKKETRVHVLLAVVTGWWIFLFSLIGAGWNALLHPTPRGPGHA